MVRDVDAKERQPYKTIQTVLERRVDKQVDWSEFSELHTIGINEIALRKGHQQYVTIISNKTQQDKLSILAVIEGRGKQEIKHECLMTAEKATLDVLFRHSPVLKQAHRYVLKLT